MPEMTARMPRLMRLWWQIEQRARESARGACWCGGWRLAQESRSCAPWS